MATSWNDLLAEVAVLTSRPELANIASLALRSTVRLIHRQNKFWRDLVEYVVTPELVAGSDDVYEIDLNAYPNWRDLAYVKPRYAYEQDFEVVTPTSLLDENNFYKTDIVWGFGSTLRVRTVQTPLVIGYYKYPDLEPVESYSDWITDQNRDLIVTMAAINVLGSVGESEMKSALTQMVPTMLNQLVADNTVLKGN